MYFLKFNLSQIGNELPQIQESLADYDSKSPYTWRKKPLFGKMEHEPVFGTLKLHHRAKRTDYLSCVYVNTLNDILISPSFWSAMQVLRLPPYQLFNVMVGKGERRFPYHIFHLYKTNSELIDYERSTFYMIGTDSSMPSQYQTLERLSFANHYEYDAWYANRPKKCMGVCRKLYLLPTVEQHLDIAYLSLLIHGRGIIVSEHFKNTVEAAGLTGAAFEPLTQPICPNLRWLDTGLPVED